MGAQRRRATLAGVGATAFGIAVLTSARTRHARRRKYPDSAENAGVKLDEKDNQLFADF